MKKKKNPNSMTQHSGKGFYKIDIIHLLYNKILFSPFLYYLFTYEHIGISEDS